MDNRNQKTNNVDLNDDNGLKTILVICVLGVLAISFVGIHTVNGKGAFWSTIGLSGVVSLSAMLVGGFLGFLFGIPRSLQKPNTDSAVSASKKERAYTNNTNLEQISDWLTKIIVGVSLTQIPAIKENFQNLTFSVAKAYDGMLEPGFAVPYAAGLMIFYSICGFLAVYLWAKIYLLHQLVVLENFIDGELSMKIEKVEQGNIKLEIGKINSELDEFMKQKNRIKIVEEKEEFRGIIAAAKPDPIRFIDDCQKGRWGGKESSAGFVLGADFTTNEMAGEPYLIELFVKGSGDGLLQGTVYFFLHDSYYPYCIKVAEPVNNRASVTISSYEAFTVGAVCNGGAVKLELDLNKYDKSPEDYRYKEELLTVDGLNAKLEELKKKEIE